MPKRSYFVFEFERGSEELLPLFSLLDDIIVK